MALESNNKFVSMMNIFIKDNCLILLTYMNKASSGRHNSNSMQELEVEDGEDRRGGRKEATYYITMQMHTNKHDKEKNRKISEMLATHELLSFAGTEQASDQKRGSKSRSHSKSRTKSRNARSRSNHNVGEFKANREVKDSRVNIIHGVYNRHQASQQSVKENCHKESERERESSSRNGRNMSNFQRLKQEAEQLEKSNVVLGIKEQNTHYHKASTKDLSLKQQIVSKGRSNPGTRSQRYRYKQSLSNRNQNMHTTMTDIKTYYHHISNQIINRSTHRLSTQGDGQGELIETEIEVVRKGSMKGHYKSASEWNISKKHSKTDKEKDLTQQPGIHSFPLKTQGHVITNEFIPMVNRSILDKNRQNIKKISKNVNRILSSKLVKELAKNADQRCVTMGDEVSNENIDEFIRTKMTILDITKNTNQANNHVNRVGLQSFYNASFATNRTGTNLEPPGEQRNDASVKREVKTNRKTIESQCQSQPQLVKTKRKIETSNAAKFYRPQLEKYKGKSNVMVIDPHLKAKAMQISTKDVKKNNDIVIICL